MITVILPAKYCVYRHRIGKVVFYVGKGRAQRPFDFSNRNQDWHRVVSLYGRFTVEIAGWCSSDETARQAESFETVVWRPQENCERLLEAAVSGQPLRPLERLHALARTYRKECLTKVVGVYEVEK